MDKLEDRIVKKMYQFETKRTTMEIVATVVGLAIGVTLVIFLTQAVWTELAERQTVDLVTIFISDSESAIANWDALIIGIYHESPKALLLGLFFVGYVSVFLIIYMARNHRRVVKKLRSLVAFWGLKK